MEAAPTTAGIFESVSGESKSTIVLHDLNDQSHKNENVAESPRSNHDDVQSLVIDKTTTNELCNSIVHKTADGKPPNNEGMSTATNCIDNKPTSDEPEELLQDIKIDTDALQKGLSDIKSLQETRESHIWETCNCCVCRDKRATLTSETYLFESVNQRRTDYVKALEYSIRRLSLKYKAASAKEEPAVENAPSIHGPDGMIEDIGRMIDYEDEDGDFVESLPETEKPKDEAEKSKDTYILSITKRVRRFNTGGRYEYRPVAGGPYLTINSLPIIDALRKSATFHPPGLLEKNKFELFEPYDYIIHHMDKLESYVSQNPAEKTLSSHVEKLKLLIHENCGDEMTAERDLYKKSPPRCTFKMLWLLFEKGQDVIAKVNGEWRAYVVSNTQSIKRHGQGNRPSYFAVDCWYMDFNGKEFGRVQHPDDSNFTIFPFQGTKEIASLPIYPLQYHKKNPDQNDIRKFLIERGQKFWKLRTAGQREYQGETLDSSKRYIDNRVMIDYQNYVRYHPDNILLGEIEIEGKMLISKPINGCNCLECLKSKDDNYKGSATTFDKYDHVSQTEDTLTNHQLMLLTNRVPGFYLQDRSWVMLDVGKLIEYETSDQGFRQLVLPEGHTNVIEALIKTRKSPNQAGRRAAYSADIVKGKGKGLIILLHGAPGVGKTSTAECVAEMTNLPLFPITCGDIGTEASQVEKNLKQHFELAQLWNAVLLLDEADVFLQSRENDGQSLQRNSLVSVFLRVLEYYEGILFLTTNRVGDFDEAFKSRIHVTLYYPHLDQKATTNIWQNLIDSLERIRPDISLTQAAQTYLLESREVHRTKWNGRQIRNAFQTAVAMAEYEENREGTKKNIQISAKYFKKVVELSQKFETYMKETRGNDDETAARESIRAKAEKDRKKEQKKKKHEDEDDDREE